MITGKKSLMTPYVSNVARQESNMGNVTDPNRLRKPKVSTMTPTKGHLRNTSRMPPMKQTVPRNFCFRAKK